MLTLTSVYWHTYVLDLFRPFVLSDNQRAFKRSTPFSRSPEAIFAASIEQLKRLVLLYFKSYLSYAPRIWANVAFIHLANTVLKDRSNPEWRFFFLLCIRGYQKLVPFLAVAEKIAKGFLGMAVEEGAMSGAESYSIGRMMRSETLQYVRGLQDGFVIDLDLALVDQGAARVDTLRQKFEETSIYEELTAGIF